MSYNTLGIIKGGIKEKMPVVVVSPKADGPDYVEVTADGVKTATQLFLDLLASADESRIKGGSFIRFGSDNGVLYYQYEWAFSRTRTTDTNTSTVSMIKTSNSTATYFYSLGTTVYNADSVPTAGTKMTLYYTSATLDLTTRASNTIYDNSNSGLNATEVQGAIDEVVALDTTSITSGMGINIDINLAKRNGIVTGWIGNGTFTASVDDVIAQMPAGYYPAVLYDFKDTYSGARIWINTDGEIIAKSALSGTAVRGSFTFVAQ